MMLTEKEVTVRIFRKGFRLTPVWEIMQEEEFPWTGNGFSLPWIMMRLSAIDRIILFNLIAANGCGMIYYKKF